MLHYRCKLTDSWINYQITNNTADMKMFDFKFENIKPFFVLVRDSIEELKEKNIKFIRHMVLKDEYDKILKNKTTWKIINYDPIYNAYLLECKIENFLKNFGVGHEIK